MVYKHIKLLVTFFLKTLSCFKFYRVLFLLLLISSYYLVPFYLLLLPLCPPDMSEFCTSGHLLDWFLLCIFLVFSLC